VRSSIEKIFAIAVFVALLALAWIGQRGDEYGLTERFGYNPDPQAAAAPDVMEKAEPQDTFLWRAMDAAHRSRYGKPWKCSNQKGVGSCVAHGACHAVYCSEAVSWSLGERDEPPLLPMQAACYGGSRVEARGKREGGGGYSDGSTGYHAAKWLREWGVIYKRQYPSVDCTISNEAIEKSWGNWGCGGEGDNGRLDEEAKKKPCLYVAKVSTWQEIVAAITTGIPVTLASSQGFSRTLDRNSFAAPRGVWMHQMAAIGYRSDIPGIAIVNSWGSYLSYTAPRWPEDLPDGVFWADRRTIERILSQGDCWAISEVKFEYRDIHHNEWLMK
jgi:hypothetical protein